MTDMPFAAICHPWLFQKKIYFCICVSFKNRQQAQIDKDEVTQKGTKRNCEGNIFKAINQIRPYVKDCSFLHSLNIGSFLVF